jgi:ATP-dependent metalloprotease
VAQLPESDQVSWTRKQLLARLDVTMGGRVAEELVFGDENVTSGAASDIEQATRIAKAMVTQYGMSNKLGLVSYRNEDTNDISPDSRSQIEHEIRHLIEAARERALLLIKSHNDELQRLAHALLEYETLTRDEIEMILKGKSLPSSRLKVIRTNSI